MHDGAVASICIHVMLGKNLCKLQGKKAKEKNSSGAAYHFKVYSNMKPIF